MKKRKFIIILSILMAFIIPFSSLNINAYAADSKKYILPTDKKDKGKTYAYYTAVTWKGGPQYAVLNSGTYKGVKYKTTTDKETGIRMVGEYYCAAVGTYFSKGVYKNYGIGSKFIVKTSTGKTFKIIRCDTKADKDTDSKYHLWHKDSFNSVVEFYVEGSKIPKKVKNAGSYAALSQFSGSIISVTPDGKAPPSDGSSSNNDAVTDNADDESYSGKSFACVADITYKLATGKESENGIEDLKDLSIQSKSSASYVSKSEKQSASSLNNAINLVQVDARAETDNIDGQEHIPIGPLTNSNALTTGYLGKPTKNVTYSCPNLEYSNGHWHGGNDVSCGVGTNVYAMDGGIVVATGIITCNGRCGRSYHSGGKAPNGKYYCSYGTYIKIKHPTTKGTYWTLYAHLSKVNVKVGDVVMKGQKIGLSGNRGNSSGPHLHIELRKNSGNSNSSGNVLCPSKYIGVSKTYAGK